MSKGFNNQIFEFMIGRTIYKFVKSHIVIDDITYAESYKHPDFTILKFYKMDELYSIELQKDDCHAYLTNEQITIIFLNYINHYPPYNNYKFDGVEFNNYLFDFLIGAEINSLFNKKYRVADTNNYLFTDEDIRKMSYIRIGYI